MEAISPRSGRHLDEMGVHEVFKEDLRHLGGGIDKRSGQRGREVGTGDEAQPAEHASRGRVERAVGEGEAGTDPAVTGHQRFQPAPLAAQALRQRGDAHGGTARKLCPGDAHSQRQVPAELHGLRRRFGLGVDPFLPSDAGQELMSLPLSQSVQDEQMRALACYEAGQPVPAGDEHQAPGACGEQRAHLVGREGVVQEDQAPPPCEQAPVESGLRGRRQAAGSCTRLDGRRQRRILAQHGDLQPLKLDAGVDSEPLFQKATRGLVDLQGLTPDGRFHKEHA
ncbi:MAG TPA: hypothetical protein VII47_03455 [Actinomycetota bacterium]